MKDKWYQSSFAHNIGIGLAWLFVCLGIGTCSMLSNAKIEYNSNKESK